MNPLLVLAMLTIGGTTLAGSIKIIKQGDEALIETLGRYDGRKLQPGLNFITPFISYVTIKETVREKLLKVPPQNCITRDNVSIKVDAVLYWRILDLEKAYYKVQNLQSAISNLVLTQIRSEMGRLSLNESFTARTEINENLLRELDVATAPWGVKITRVELLDIVPSSTVQGAMELQMSAERKKQAAILTSEGERQALINSAQGEAEAQLIEAKARQEVAVLDAQAQEKREVIQARGTAAAMQVISTQLQEDPNSGQAL
jgi:regulator of protease activity HflC (stomatin/prohibitin superfamily)